MSKNLKYCSECNITGKNAEVFSIISKLSTNVSPEQITEFYRGYLYGVKEEKMDNGCPFCGSNLIDSEISSDDFNIIAKTSNYDRQFLEAMIQLRKDDIIEFQSRMAQFRTQLAQQKQVIQEHENQLRCPKCGSTNITTGARGANWAFGFIGASKTVNRCGNCGHTWKP